MNDYMNAAEPEVGATAVELATDSRDPGLRKPVSGQTKKPAKSMAGTLTVDQANGLHHEFEDLVFCIEHDFRSLDQLFDLLYTPNLTKELALHYSGEVFRGIRDQVNSLQACIRKVRDLGHMSKEAGDE